MLIERKAKILVDKWHADFVKKKEPFLVKWVIVNIGQKCWSVQLEFPSFTLCQVQYRQIHGFLCGANPSELHLPFPRGRPMESWLLTLTLARLPLLLPLSPCRLKVSGWKSLHKVLVGKKQVAAGYSVQKTLHDKSVREAPRGMYVLYVVEPASPWMVWTPLKIGLLLSPWTWASLEGTTGGGGKPCWFPQALAPRYGEQGGLWWLGMA